MQKNREELSQQAIEYIENFFRYIHYKGVARHNNEDHHTPFADLNLSKRQIFFLFIVAKSKDGISVKDLAKYSMVTSGAVTQFIDSLIEINLVKREEDPQDRRALKIKLTDYASTRFANFKKCYFGAISPAFDELSDDELITLINLLEKITPDSWCNNI